jgi:hypothetical protein
MFRAMLLKSLALMPTSLSLWSNYRIGAYSILFFAQNLRDKCKSNSHLDMSCYSHLDIFLIIIKRIVFYLQQENSTYYTTS